MIGICFIGVVSRFRCFTPQAVGYPGNAGIVFASGDPQKINPMYDSPAVVMNSKVVLLKAHAAVDPFPVA